MVCVWKMNSRLVAQTKLKILNFWGKFAWLCQPISFTFSQHLDIKSDMAVKTVLWLNTRSCKTQLYTPCDYIINTDTTLLSFPTFLGLPQLIQSRNDDYIQYIAKNRRKGKPSFLLTLLANANILTVAVSLIITLGAVQHNFTDLRMILWTLKLCQ